jgi:threonine synthase
VEQVKDMFIAELFHGPTFAFKDIALQVVSNLCNYFLLKRKKRMTVIVATSGDTGTLFYSISSFSLRQKEVRLLLAVHAAKRVWSALCCFHLEGNPLDGSCVECAQN